MEFINGKEIEGYALTHRREIRIPKKTVHGIFVRDTRYNLSERVFELVLLTQLPEITVAMSVAGMKLPKRENCYVFKRAHLVTPVVNRKDLIGMLK